nr:unnamed protein product [Callosobruchus analis]
MSMCFPSMAPRQCGKFHLSSKRFVYSYILLPIEGTKKKQISTLFQENENEPADSPSQESDDSSSETVPCTSVQTGHPRPPRRKQNAPDSMDLSNAVLQSVNEHFKHPPVKEDHFDIFGKNVAMI